jgi:hypothetical protein
VSQVSKITSFLSEQLSFIFSRPIPLPPLPANPLPPIHNFASLRQSPNYQDQGPVYTGCLSVLWNELSDFYFPDLKHLKNYTVSWSKRRQIRTLASCNLNRMRVIVAKELDHEPHFIWLAPLLYHEMCHAALGTTIRQRGQKTRWHGPEFKKLEQMHPLIKEFDMWVKNGGWLTAVRSSRAREAHLRRTKKVKSF